MDLWVHAAVDKCYKFAPTLVKYGPPLALAGFIGYQMSRRNSRHVESVSTDRELDEELEEFAGVLRLVTSGKYTAGDSDARAAYIVLQGPILQVYESHGTIPPRELHNEPNIELKLYRKTTYNIFGCQIKLLPHKLDKIFRWEHKYPVKIVLGANCMVEVENLGRENEEIATPCSDKCLILFARSDRDKEAWTRRFRAATRQTKVPVARKDDPILFVNAGKPYRAKPPIYMGRKTQGLWMNSLLSRIVTDDKTKTLIETSLTFHVQELLDNLKFGDKLETLLRMTVSEIDLKNLGSPKIIGVSVSTENDLGLWEEILVHYKGMLRIRVEIKLNPRAYGREDAHRPVTQNYEDTPWISRLGYLNHLCPGGWMEGTRFYLEVNLDLLRGGVAINIPRAPTDTAWLGFREDTRLVLTGNVFWGQWRLPWMYGVVESICEQLTSSFERNYIMPNMLQVRLPMWQS